MTPNQPARAVSRRIVKAYDYRDQRGDLLFQVVRMEPKTFRQRVPKAGGGWSWSVKDVRRVLYRLHELVAADSAKVVFIPEGGKDVSDWLDAGGSRERLIDLVKAAPVFQPPANRRAAPKLEKWGNIEPLGIPSVLPFPVGALPGVLADFVAAEAEATQTPPR